MDRTVNMTAQQILALTASTIDAQMQRSLRTNKRYEEIVASYATGCPLIDKVVYISRLGRDHYLTDAMHSMNAAVEAGYRGEFTTKIKTVHSLDEVAQQILALNNVTVFPAAKKFALNLQVTAITSRIGARLRLFTSVSHETIPGCITHLAIGQLLQAFMDENTNAPKNQTASRVLSATPAVINDFVNHMNRLCDIDALVEKKAKVRDICIMIGWAALGTRSNYTYLISNTSRNFDKDCTKMTKTHRAIQKKAGWKIIFINNAR